MSEKIDWSKAPDSAMVLLKHVRDGAYAVAESYGDEAKTWHWPDPRYSFPLMPARWRVVAERPTTPSWSGEGLPPAGVVCEAFYMGHPQGVVSVRYSGQCMILWSEDRKSEQCGQADHYLFKPIRTPEQIAADERERFAEELTRAMAMDGRPRSMEQARRMYDLGYRKP